MSLVCTIYYVVQNNERKISHHIISRLGATNVPKGRFGRPKLQLSSKMAKFAGQIGIDPTLIFCVNDFFCAILWSTDLPKHSCDDKGSDTNPGMYLWKRAAYVYDLICIYMYIYIKISVYRGRIFLFLHVSLNSKVNSALINFLLVPSVKDIYLNIYETLSNQIVFSLISIFCCQKSLVCTIYYITNTNQSSDITNINQYGYLE